MGRNKDTGGKMESEQEKYCRRKGIKRIVSQEGGKLRKEREIRMVSESD